jgi:heme oxygenase
MRRKEALQKDLDHYYGSGGNWKSDSENRPAVKKYLDHLKKVRPLTLSCFFYCKLQHQKSCARRCQSSR